MARIDNLNNFLTDVASAIKEKKGDNTPIPASNFDTEITNLPSSGGGKYAPRCITFRSFGGSDLDYELANLDVSNLTTMAGMFFGNSNLTKLDLRHFNTSNITSMAEMFFRCGKLTEILGLDNFNTSNVTSMLQMFYSNGNAKAIDVSAFDTSNVKNIGEMFAQCYEITDLDISHFDMLNVTRCYNMLERCTKLTNLKFGINLGKAFTYKQNNYSDYKLTFTNTANLTHDSLMSVINNLYDLNLTYKVATGGTLYTQQLVLGSTNLKKLTADEIAIATNKGWTVS